MVPPEVRPHYYQDPLSYMQHRADQGYECDVSPMAIEDWRARRRSFRLKGQVSAWNDKDAGPTCAA